MQRIRPAVEVLCTGIGVDHALASRRLYTDGAEVLYDYATEHDEEELGGLTVVRTGQREFAEIVRDYLKRITYGDDGWASQVRLPTYQHADVSSASCARPRSPVPTSTGSTMATSSDCGPRVAVSGDQRCCLPQSAPRGCTVFPYRRPAKAGVRRQVLIRSRVRG
jgi:hypothetical protein